MRITSSLCVYVCVCVCVCLCVYNINIALTNSPRHTLARSPKQ